MDEDNIKDRGPDSSATSANTTSPNATDNTYDFMAYKAGTHKPRGPKTILGKDAGVSMTAPEDPSDPGERRLLINLADGNIEISGRIGLTNSFLAVGRKDGSIKFAAAPGKWEYVFDITDLSGIDIMMPPSEETGPDETPPETAA